jgi:predicted small secreted protein
MKFIAVVVVALALQACGTAGGLVGGMGEDLKKAGDWIKSK